MQAARCVWLTAVMPSLAGQLPQVLEVLKFSAVQKNVRVEHSSGANSNPVGVWPASDAGGAVCLGNLGA